jgi:hypothetical protein
VTPEILPVAAVPCDTGRVDFGTVLFLIVLLVLPIAAVLFAGAFGLLEDLGRGGLFTEEPAPAPPPLSAASRMEREEEIRQLVQASHDRRLARGRPGINVEKEVRRLLELEPADASGSGDAALREEIRQLVIARNDRRVARGEVPLDVDTEIERQLRDLRM